jgi:beta-carotene ketolase (CrtO type)
MSDFGAVVIGGGHHGTIIAAYLAKAGLKVGVFERQDRLGGGCVTEDGPVPGFRMPFCSEYSRFYSHPAFHDFNLYDEGLNYVAPETGTGILFNDGTSLVGYPAWELADPKTGATKYSEENVKKTYEQIAQFSKDDAETYLDLTEKYKTKWGAAFSHSRFSAPTKHGEPDFLEKLLTDPKSGLKPIFQYMTVRQMSHYLFESEELRVLFTRGMQTSTGCAPYDVPGLEGLMGGLSVTFSWAPPSIAVGGNQAITDALVSAGKKLGAEYFTNAEVTGIITEDGVAKGIRLAKGTEIIAKQLVVSDTGIPQLFSLLGEKEYITSKIRREIDSLDFDRHQLLQGALALHDPPQYKTTTESNRDAINHTFRLFLVPKDLRYFEDKMWHEMYLMGFGSSIVPLTTVDSLWDHTRTPEGKHVVYFEEFTVPLRFFSYREWRRIRETFVKEHLRPQWQKYAPNMTQENVIGSRIVTPVEVFSTHPDMIEGSFGLGAHISSQTGWFRGIPELAHYRTPVKNLYICSSAVPGGQGIARGSSYRCYKVIAGDLGLPYF